MAVQRGSAQKLADLDLTLVRAAKGGRDMGTARRGVAHVSPTEATQASAQSAGHRQ